MSVSSPSNDGRAITSPSSATSASLAGTTPPPEPLLVAPPTAPFPAQRERSVTRGRAYSATSPNNASSRATTPAAQSRNKPSIEIERRPSNYGHHRQTSIVHGVQHSRNPSLLNPANASPLSPPKLTNGSQEHVNGTGAPGLKKSPSMSAMHNHGANGTNGATIPPQNRSFEGSGGQRPPGRMHSGKVRHVNEHQRSQSRAQGPGSEVKTVGEYALHHLFTSFIAEADERIERCIQRMVGLDPRIEDICGPGADPAFDQLIASLGHINRHKPNSLIDSVIHWRRKKADVANEMFSELQAMRGEAAHSTQRHATNGVQSAPASPPGAQELVAKESAVSWADRRSALSIYILCRVLIGIIGQTTLKALNRPDGSLNTAARLEEVIYSQLQGADPDTLAAQPGLQANWGIRAQLLGVMSVLRFEEVSQRFLRDLEQAQKKLSVKGASEPKLAAKTALLLRGMRWLKIRSSPPDDWQKSCDMLHLLARFFAEVHGRTMKHAYAALLEQLLLPIAATASHELNIPKWREVMNIVQPKITQMLSKADHWPYVFPLQAVMLCVSPAEQFATQWLSLVTSFQPKSRDRAGRSHALKAICRLVWRYVYKCSDSNNAVAKKIDEVVKLLFQGGKRVLISTDPIIADPLIQFIRIIGYKYQDLCFRTIIFPLMNSDLFSGHESQLKIENLDPEKTVIAIRAFLAVMTDLEKGEAPPFPTSFECDPLMDPSSRLSTAHRRTRSQGFAVSAGRTERLSRPVATTNLNDVTKEYYVKFCKILGQLTMICDNTFGGQAVLDEKFASQTPKTPMAEAFTFNKRDDFANPTDVRQQYYDLLHVAVEALPRCLSPHLPINALVNLLCTGTAHVQNHIASSSAQSLKSIARQSYAQQVTIGFARFIFNFDDRYATVSDGSLLGPGHIENTLKLYVELLQIWIEDIEKRTEKATSKANVEEESPSRPLPLDLSGILAHVDEVESHGLFFLCSPSTAVRAVAVNVLRLITKFDIALGKPCTRIISILEGSSERVIDVNDERLSLAERSRLQRGLRKVNTNGTLVELCSSEQNHDKDLWSKIFPNLIRLSAEICLHAVTLTRELVCQRLSHSYRTINSLAKQPPNVNPEQAFMNGKIGSRFNSLPEVTIEQWKIHLIFACTTLTNIGGSASSQHSRKSSKSSSTSQEKIASAHELFQRVAPFLEVPNAAIRAAAVAGLGATNVNLYHMLLECLQPWVQRCSHEAKQRVSAHQRNLSSPQPSLRMNHLRTEITHLLSLTCHLLRDPMMTGDDYALSYLMDYMKHLRVYLSDTEIQADLSLQKLRTHFCTLGETLYDCVRQLKDSSRWISFQSRQATFSLMENWCGFSPNEAQLRRQEDLRRSRMDMEQNMRPRDVMDSSAEKDRNELQFAALSAMAGLCAGPIEFVADNRVLMKFDIRRLLAWVNAIFGAPSDRTHALGRKALQNLIVHNLHQQSLMASTLRMCYIAQSSKALTSYFEVVIKILTENTNVTTPFWKIVCAGLYTLGNEDSNIRMKSAQLLRTLEERQGKTSKLQDLDISVSDKTTAVYKLAQFEVSCRLAHQHPELAFHVFSEFSVYFNELQPDHQRNMVSGMLPWIQTIELQLDPDPSGGPTAMSYMLLVNLFEITVKSSITLHNEIQALWQALATGPYAGNVQLVLEFIITICLDKKEQNFVAYARQIVVYLSKTPAGARVIEYLLLRIHPKAMVSDRHFQLPRQIPNDAIGLPYIADLSTVLPSGAKQNGISLGQLSLILLVDLIVSPVQLPADKIPTLLHVVLTQWDQYIGIVQEQAREMLVHLIHELVISKIEPGSTDPDKKSIEDFIEFVRKQDPKIMWPYDSELRPADDESKGVSDSMAYVVDEVVKIFSIAYPGIKEELGRVAMNWATSCAVRHIACRSFQIFRCVLTTLDHQMLADMLARLSNTIADDENHDYLVFSLEILTTIRVIIDGLGVEDLFKFPQLFWTTCACLDTIFEREYQEGLNMLGLLLAKMDLNDPAILDILKESRPLRWEGGFRGVHALLYKGVRSSVSMERSLAVMESLMKLPSNDIVGSEDRLLFTVLANLPRYLHDIEDGKHGKCLVTSSETLAYAAEEMKFPALARVLQSFAQDSYRSGQKFLEELMAAIRASFFPAFEFRSLVFLMGMVNNQTSWVKCKTMEILNVMIMGIDMRQPEISSQGPDLISPLLRLLQTEHCQQALSVLDNVIDMTGTPLDNKHLRMSMAGSHSSRATRKEYDSTQSLYGIPEESGWSIPMPAAHSAYTRANVHAVFYTLSYMTNDGMQDQNEEPTFDLIRDEDSFDEYSYYTQRTGTMMSDDTRADGNMGELAMKLDTLDDFFDEQSDAVHSPMAARYPSGLVEERENLYDQQVAPILHRSLKRNTSVSSFQTGFAERGPPSNREPAIMNPGAFAPSSRPGLHNRSITSPMPNTKKPKTPPRLHNDLTSGDEGGDEPEPFSDDDLSVGRVHTAEELYEQNQHYTHTPYNPHLQQQYTVKSSAAPTSNSAAATNTTSAAGAIRAGFRSGLRRLTSTSGNREARDAVKSAAGSSGAGGVAIAGSGLTPQVPKVPTSWLKDPTSGEP